MKIAKAATKISLYALATSVHGMVVDVTGGRHSRALCGAALFSIAILVYFELEQLLILMAVLMAACSILTMKIQEIHVAPSSSVVGNLVSPVPEKPGKLGLAGIDELAGITEQKTPDAKSWRPVVRSIDDDNSKSNLSPTQVCTFSASDTVSVVKKETPSEESAIIATPKNEPPSPTIASITKGDNTAITEADITAITKADTHTGDAMTAVVKATDSLPPTTMLKTKAVKVTTDSSLPMNGIKTSSTKKIKITVSKEYLLPENVLKTTSTGNAVIPTFPANKVNTATKTMLKKNAFKKTLKGKGVISFIYHTREWGRIHLDTATKWGETQVFFHRDHLLGVACRRALFLGQSVKLEYSYRRNNKGKQDSLRANRVELMTTGEKKWRSAVAACPQRNWRSRSMLRRPVSPPTRQPKTSPPMSRIRKCPSPILHPQVHVAKGPSVDGHRGFRFRRNVRSA